MARIVPVAVAAAVAVPVPMALAAGIARAVPVIRAAGPALTVARATPFGVDVGRADTAFDPDR